MFSTINTHLSTSTEEAIMSEKDKKNITPQSEENESNFDSASNVTKQYINGMEQRVESQQVYRQPMTMDKNTENTESKESKESKENIESTKSTENTEIIENIENNTIENNKLNQSESQSAVIPEKSKESKQSNVPLATEGKKLTRQQRKMAKQAKRLAKRQGFGGFMRKVGWTLALVLVLAIGFLAWYASHSTIDFGDNKTVEKKEASDVLTHIEANQFDGHKLKLQLDDEVVNAYLSSKIDYSAKTDLPLGLSIDALHYDSHQRQLYVNVGNDFINTTLISEVEMSLISGKLAFQSDKLAVGKWYLPLINQWGQLPLKQLEEQMVLKKTFYSITGLKQMDEGIELELTVDEQAVKEVLAFNQEEVDQSLIEQLNKYPKFFKDKKLLNTLSGEANQSLSTTREMIRRITTDRNYLTRMMSLLLPERRERLVDDLADYHLISQEQLEIAYQGAEEEKQKLLLAVGQADKEQKKETVRAYVMPVFKRVEEYLDKEVKEPKLLNWQGYPYLRNTNRIVTYDLIDHYNYLKSYETTNSVPLQSELYFYMNKQKLVIAVKDEEAGTFLIEGPSQMQRYEDLSAIEKVLNIGEKPRPNAYQNPVAEGELVRIKTTIRNFTERDNRLFIHHLKANQEWAFVVFSSENTNQSLWQLVLKKDQLDWSVYGHYNETDVLPMQLLLQEGFSPNLLPIYDLKDYTVHHYSNEKLEQLFNRLNQKGYADLNLTTLDYFLRVDDLAVLTVKDGRGFILEMSGDTIRKIYQLEQSDKFLDYDYLLNRYAIPPTFLFPLDRPNVLKID